MGISVLQLFLSVGHLKMDEKDEKSEDQVDQKYYPPIRFMLFFICVCLCSAAMMWTVGMTSPMDAQHSGHETGPTKPTTAALSQARNHGK